VALKIPSITEPGGICSFGSGVFHRACKLSNNADHGTNMAGTNYGTHTESLQGPLQRLMHSETHKHMYVVLIVQKHFQVQQNLLSAIFFVVVL